MDNYDPNDPTLLVNILGRGGPRGSCLTHQRGHKGNNMDAMTKAMGSRAKRLSMLKGLAALAKESDERGDVVMRQRYSNDWYALATEAEALRAPLYLRWDGR